MAAPNHSEANGIHPPWYTQDAAPVTAGDVHVVAHAVHVQTTDGFKRIRQRNADNTAWELWGYIGPPPHRTITAAGDPMVDDDELIYLNPTAASFTFNLLAIASRTGKRTLRFKNIADPATSINTATLLPDGAETVNGSAVINPGEYGELAIRDNTTWERIS